MHQNAIYDSDEEEVAPPEAQVLADREVAPAIHQARKTVTRHRLTQFVSGAVECWAFIMAFKMPSVFVGFTG